MSMFTLLAHWLACIWYAIGHEEFEDHSSTGKEHLLVFDHTYLSRYYVLMTHVQTLKTLHLFTYNINTFVITYREQSAINTHKLTALAYGWIQYH